MANTPLLLFGECSDSLTTLSLLHHVAQAEAVLDNALRTLKGLSLPLSRSKQVKDEKESTEPCGDDDRDDPQLPVCDVFANTV